MVVIATDVLDDKPIRRLHCRDVLMHLVLPVDGTLDVHV